MKKLLSTITAASLLAASTVGVCAYDHDFSLKDMLFGGIQSIQLFDEAVVTTPTATATVAPTLKPTTAPTSVPTTAPTAAPTATPTTAPTATPTTASTATPTTAPTATPTTAPTATPTTTPTEQVTQSPTAITLLALNKQKLELDKGETFDLEISAEPKEASLDTIKWVSSNDKCVTVSNGHITAVAAGHAIVTVIDTATKLTASCYIDVQSETGTLDVSVTKGVKQILLTKDGETTEVKAGLNSIEAGTYDVLAINEANYALKDYAKTVTISVDKTTELEVSAEKTLCEVSLPSVVGCTIQPVEGSTSPVAMNGSYSFKIVFAQGMNTDELSVSANGTVIKPTNDVYTVSNITDDVVITVKGVEPVSNDATLKSVKVGDYEATLGENNQYTVTVPYGEKITAEKVTVVPSNSKSSYAVTADDGVFVIMVKAEDGTLIVYTLKAVNAAQTELDKFNAEVKELNFNDLNQSSTGNYDTMATVKANIKDKVDAVLAKYTGMSYEIQDGTYEAAEIGTLTKPSGKNGYYNFKIVLSDGTNTRTVDVTIVIYSYKYVIALSNITSTATTITIRNIDSNVEVTLFTEEGGRLRTWQTPKSGEVTFNNLSGGTTYLAKARAVGSTEIPTDGTLIKTKDSAKTTSSKYYTVTFDVGEHGTIVSGQAKQTVKLTRTPAYPTVKADDGYVFKGWSKNGVLVDDPDSVFIRSTTTFIAVYEKSTGSAYNTNRPSSTVDSPAKPTTTILFSDVTSGNWYYDSVMNIAKKGFMNGTENNKFEPNANLTRAMLVTILHRYAYEPKATTSTFADVSSDAWYASAVAWAEEAGIVDGVAPGKFDPNANITREQLAAIMYRYATAFGYDTSASGNIIKYQDSQEISDWAQSPLIWTTGAGIIGGKDDNCLDPGGKATRAEAAAIIERFDKYING